MANRQLKDYQAKLDEVLTEHIKSETDLWGPVCKQSRKGMISATLPVLIELTAKFACAAYGGFSHEQRCEVYGILIRMLAADLTKAEETSHGEEGVKIAALMPNDA
jgi:hypothetical protein